MWVEVMTECTVVHYTLGQFANQNDGPNWLSCNPHPAITHSMLLQLETLRVSCQVYYITIHTILVQQYLNQV